MRNFTILCFLILLCSCKKEQIVYKLDGKIVNHYSNSPISNVSLKFFQKEVNSTTFNDNFIFIDSTSTNELGTYSFSFDRERITTLKVELNASDYYYSEVLIHASDLATDQINTHDFSLESIAWVKIKLINSFVENGEQLNFLKQNVKEDCIDCCANNYTTVYEQTPDTTFVCPVIGDRYFKYSYGEVLESTSVTDSIYCPIKDTTTLTISY